MLHKESPKQSIETKLLECIYFVFLCYLNYKIKKKIDEYSATCQNSNYLFSDSPSSAWLASLTMSSTRILPSVVQTTSCVKRLIDSAKCNSKLWVICINGSQRRNHWPLSLERLLMSSWTLSLPNVSLRYIAAAATSSEVTLPSWSLWACSAHMISNGSMQVRKNVDPSFQFKAKAYSVVVLLVRSIKLQKNYLRGLSLDTRI